MQKKSESSWKQVAPFLPNNSNIVWPWGQCWANTNKLAPVWFVLKRGMKSKFLFYCQKQVYQPHWCCLCFICDILKMERCCVFLSWNCILRIEYFSVFQDFAPETPFAGSGACHLFCPQALTNFCANLYLMILLLLWRQGTAMSDW